MDRAGWKQSVKINPNPAPSCGADIGRLNAEVSEHVENNHENTNEGMVMELFMFQRNTSNLTRTLHREDSAL